MTFDYKTIRFINHWGKYIYNNNYTCFSTAPHTILNNYLLCCEEYVRKFKKCINTVNYVCTYKYVDDENEVDNI